MSQFCGNVFFFLYLFAILSHLQKTVTSNRIQINWLYLLQTFLFPFGFCMSLSRHLLGFPARFRRQDILIWDKSTGAHSEKSAICIVYILSLWHRAARVSSEKQQKLLSTVSPLGLWAPFHRFNQLYTKNTWKNTVSEDWGYSSVDTVLAYHA